MLLATLALFVVSLGYGVVVPALPRLAARGDAAAGAAELSIVYASYAAAKILAQVPGGVWVDRRGHGRVLVIALAVYVLSLLGFLAPLGPAWFALMRAIEGAATGLVYPAVFARVLLTSDAARAGRRIGTAVGVGSSGLLVGPVLGALLGERTPALPVLVAAALGALVLAGALASPSSTPPRDTTRTVAGELRALASLSRDRRFLATMLPIGFNKLTFSAYQGLLPLVGPEVLGAGPRGVAVLFVVIGVVFALAQPVGGALVDRLPAHKIVLSATLPLLGALAALAFVRDLPTFAALFGAHIFAQSVVFTATMKETAREHGTESTYGGVFGLMATLTDTMTILGPLLFLNAYAYAGARTFAIMAVVGALFALAWRAGVRASASGSARGSGTR